MTRILRLLLIAAVAWPFLGGTAAAQEMARNGSNVPNVAIEKKVVAGNVDASTSREVNNAANVVKLPKTSINAIAKVEPMSDAPKGAITKSQQSEMQQPSEVKTMTTPPGKSAHSLKAKGDVSLKAEDLPAGYARITLTAGDVWGDGSGYQMLLDADHSTYGSTIPTTGALNTSGDVASSVYAQFEYKIPTNADGSLTTSNIVVNNSISIDIPAGTYDYCITNPTPGDRVWIASENGDVGGRGDDYVFESGKVYEFSVERVGSNDGVMLVIYNPNDPRPPTDLTARPDLSTGTSADVDWTPGDNNEGWNLRYRPYIDPSKINRFWNFALDDLTNQTTGWTVVDSDNDGYNWDLAYSSNAQDDACFYSFSYDNNTAYTPDNWLITPPVGLGGTLKFKSWNYSSRYQDKIAVYVYQGELDTSNGVNINDFVKISSDLAPGTSHTEYTFDLSSYSGVGHILFRHYNSSDKYAIFVDDVEVTVPNGISESEIPDWIYVNNATNPYTINGLTPETTYEVQVQGTGNNTTSDWTSSQYFTTHVVTVDPLDIVVAGEDLLNTIPPYSWTDDNGDTHSSSLKDPATDPNQMIAMIREIYTNKNLPGNLRRGFDANGGDNTPNQDVYYTGVGGIKLKDGATNYMRANSYDFDDIYGWGITGKIATPAKATLALTGDNTGQTTDAYYTHMQLDQYKPNDEGLTLLLVELKDTYVDGSNDAIYADETSYATEKDRLKAYFQNTVKSIRVITGYKRTGSGVNSGTLFKIDCNQMNKFFLLAKGQLNLDHNTLDFFSDVSWIDQNQNLDFCIAPVQMHFNTYDFFTDENTSPLFYHMFEQFSPVANDAQAGLEDIYQNLVNMDSFGVLHDCIGITGMNHEFMMYGPESLDADCQDVRDLMFFIPDYRMLDWSHRGVTSQEYHNYNVSNQPKMGLFVIRQNPITGEQTTYNGSDEYYKLHLTWNSNLLSFLPGEDGEYTLYRVTYDENGNKVYTAVGQFDPNTFAYDDYVPMQQNGQQVTYVVRGQDVEHFLSLQYSNEESFIIPGLDKAEQMRLALNSDFYYSRFYPQTVKNYYSNRLVVNNNIGTNIKASYLEPGTEFTFWRVPNGDVNAKVQFATVKVTSKSGGNGTLQIVPNSTAADYWDGTEYPYGYKALPASATFTYDASNPNSDVTFSGLEVYDNFWVSVANNDHPNNYGYYVALQTAVPFDMGDGTTSNAARSNTITVQVHKTAMTMNAISAQDVEDDVLHQLPATTTFNIDVKHSSKTEILRYDAYRWDSSYGTSAKPFAIINDAESTVDSEQDVAPNGEADNQDNEYTIKMDGENQTSIAIDPNDNTTVYQAPFIDNYVGSLGVADTYTYAPVVELFSPAGSGRSDYNTYGAPLQASAAGVVDVQVIKYRPSEYSWTANGKEYRYYNVTLKVDPNAEIVPEGYKIAKVRVWRKIDSQYLGEQSGKGYEGRLQLDANGEYMLVDKEGCQKGEELGGEVIGNNDGPIYSGTFGAVALENGDKIPMEFVVRVYFTKTQPSGAPMLKSENDQRYYIAEKVVSDELTYQIPTGIDGVVGWKNVVETKYYNAAGVESDVPFKGVNIMVTRYSDGSTSTVKVLK